MDIKNFNSFKELVSTPVSESEYPEKIRIIDEIFNSSYQNQEWINVILCFLNNNNQNKSFGEYYLEPDDNRKKRKYTYRFISTKEDLPNSITDDDIKVLKKLNAQPKFILFDYEEEPILGAFNYSSKRRTLKKCLESIGMPEELKEYLCEFCFYRVKNDIKDYRNHFNEELWKPVVQEHPPVSNTYPIHKRHIGFIDYQPLSDRYQVPGLLPKTQTEDNPKFKRHKNFMSF